MYCSATFFFIHLAFDGHLDLFQLLATVDCTATKLYIQIFTHFNFFGLVLLAYLFKPINIDYREILKEDESGSLKATIEDILFKAKRKRYEMLL